MNTLYNDGIDGLSGNEDVGQMSAWYILSSMGLYQVEPAGGKYIFGSPLFNKAVVNVGGGKTFTIELKTIAPRTSIFRVLSLTASHIPVRISTIRTLCGVANSNL